MADDARNFELAHPRATGKKMAETAFGAISALSPLRIMT
jgi:hypothetical protein